MCHDSMPVLGDVFAPDHRQDSSLRPRHAICQESAPSRWLIPSTVCTYNKPGIQCHAVGSFDFMNLTGGRFLTQRGHQRQIDGIARRIQTASADGSIRAFLTII